MTTTGPGTRTMPLRPPPARRKRVAMAAKGRAWSFPAGRRGGVRGLLLASVVVLPLTACKVGPDFVPPTASVANQWMELGDPSVKVQGQQLVQWWTVYHDPTLDRLIDIAYHQNLTLMAAGTRVLEARAVLGINIGEFYPQTQQIGGNVGYNQASQVDPSSNPLHELGNFWRASTGVQVGWELDLWGPAN